MATNYGSDSDSLSSSSSSDDDFLTLKSGKGAGNEDREALVRKKLLESFYGASAVQQQEEADEASAAKPSALQRKQEAVLNASHDEDDEEEDEEQRKQRSSNDLDSPYFAHEGFIRDQVIGSSVHDLLETEERLALQVRTLDSTMQTLVYENYSKFIDATDAIKSIGVSCSANEDGLAKLSRGMQTIDEQSKEVEDALGSLRDAVAEKLRVKRLLTRLDALLKLPSTLQSQIETGKFRFATKSYLAAHSILSKHSAGFESLKTIEIECHSILTDMVFELKRKLTHWSGRFAISNDDTSMQDEDADDWVPPPEPPKTMSEIFEAAGTLLLLLPREDTTDQAQVSFDSGLSPDDLKSMALAAGHRLLDRILDAHHIELQEAMLSSTSFEEDTYEAKLNRIQMAATETEASLAPKGSNLIPTTFLDNVLEAATLFGISFGSGTAPALSGPDQIVLIDFVTEAFSSFLAHVRTVLLGHHARHTETSPDTEVDPEQDAEEGDDGDEAYGEISGAMTHLLRCVRDLASGLALPEVGIDVEYASSLVDQAVEVTEALVRRRVSQKFYSLRLRVVEECLGPFAEDAISYAAEEHESRVIQIVQKANVALSDSMQMVDDTIRSVLSGGVVISSVKGVDYEMIKAAVKGSCTRFALWLASVLERLAGLESSDPKCLIETLPPSTDAEDDMAAEETPPVPATGLASLDDMSDVADDVDSTEDKVEASLRDLLSQLNDEASVTSLSDFTLAIAEMCRLAERSVMENINQSIQASGQDGKRAHKSSDIFQTGGTANAPKSNSDQDSTTPSRFHLAASRVLVLYATRRGFDAAAVACEGFSTMALVAQPVAPRTPRKEICQLLEVVKMTCLDCANVFGGERRADPIPEFLDQDDFEAAPSPSLGRKSFGGIKGLQLDVERMFMETVPVYPHPLKTIQFSRNEMVLIVMKVAFRALVEQVRVSQFSGIGYRQLQVDIALLRHLIPHYISDENLSDGINGRTILSNLLNDVLDNAGERCLDDSVVGQDAFTNQEGTTVTPDIIVRDFFASDENAPNRRFVIED